MISDETPSLTKDQVLIRVKFSPVTNFDRSCVSMSKEYESQEGRECGSEGCGIIEAVGPGVDESFRGRKVAFCHGGWSQFVVKNFNHIFIFDDKVDLRTCATSVINPLTALSIKFMLFDKGAKSFIFLGGNSTLGRILMKCAKWKGMEPIAVVRN